MCLLIPFAHHNVGLVAMGPARSYPDARRAAFSAPGRCSASVSSPRLFTPRGSKENFF